MVAKSDFRGESDERIYFMASAVKDAVAEKIGVAEYLEEETRARRNNFWWIALATVLVIATAGGAFFWVRRSLNSNAE
jgi:hypothetical protein